MEVIEIPGYTESDKLSIAKRYLVPRQLEANGLTEKQAKFKDDALKWVIEGYTREAGVRNLEREISSICRKVARKVVVEGKTFKEAITPEKVTEYLGVPRFRPSLAEETNEVGIATGLASSSRPGLAPAFALNGGRVLGYALADIGPGRLATWESMVHPDDREVSIAAQRRHFSGETDLYECELRLRHRDGHWVWVLDRGRVRWRGAPSALRARYGEASLESAFMRCVRDDETTIVS